MAEYIVRETGYPGAIKQEIVQELVRCKDCKHSEDAFIANRELWCNIHEIFMTVNYFCAEGERRRE